MKKNSNENKEIIEVNNEIVEQKNELVQNYKFERVDFNKPETILTYGQDIVDEMQNKINDATKNIERENLPAADFKKRVDKLSNFSERLDTLEERRDKLNKGLIGVLNRLFKKGDDAGYLSYNQEYQLYIDNVDRVVDDVTKMFNDAKSDFELFNNFINNMKPYIGILDEVYKFGVFDKSEYEQEVLSIEQQYIDNQDNSDLRREAIIRRQILDSFNEKLYTIQKSKVSLNELVIQWNMRQVNAIKHLNSYQSFITLDKSILKLNGTALVGAKKQKEEVEMLEYLIDGVNNALVEGPKELTEVIERTNELTKDGNIKLQTFVEVDEYLQQGIELLKQGAEEKKLFIEESSKALEKVSEHLKEFNLEIKESMLLDAYQDSFAKNKTNVKVKNRKNVRRK